MRYPEGQEGEFTASAGKMAPWVCPYGSSRPGLSDHLKTGSRAAERLLDAIASIESLGKLAEDLARNTFAAGQEMAGPNAALLRTTANLAHRRRAADWVALLRPVAERSARGNAALAHEISLSLAAVDAVHQRLVFLQRRSALASRYGRFLAEAMLRQALVIGALEKREGIQARHDFEIEAANIDYLAERVHGLCSDIERAEAKASGVLAILLRRIERVLARRAAG